MPLEENYHGDRGIRHNEDLAPHEVVPKDDRKGENQPAHVVADWNYDDYPLIVIPFGVQIVKLGAPFLLELFILPVINAQSVPN